MLVARILQCNHAFHKACIMAWVKTKVEKGTQPDCPCCRAAFPVGAAPVDTAADAAPDGEAARRATVNAFRVVEDHRRAAEAYAVADDLQNPGVEAGQVLLAEPLDLPAQGSLDSGFVNI